MKNIYLITGDDPFAIQEYAKKLIQSHCGKIQNGFSAEIYKEDEDKSSLQIMADILVSLQTPPFLVSKKTLWLQNLTFLSESKNSIHGKSTSPEGRALEKLIDFVSNNFLDDMVLIISGLGIDMKSPVYQVCEKIGTIKNFSKPELRNKYWRDNISMSIKRMTADRKMKLPEESIDYLIEIFGVDTNRISNEIEKIYCYAGREPKLNDIQNLCTGTRETLYYALSNAIATRNIDSVLESIGQLLYHAKDPDQLVLGQIRYLARTVNDLLHAKLIMSYFRIKSGQKLPQMVAKLKTNTVTEFKVNNLLSKSDWQIRLIGCQAEKFTGIELVRALSLFAEADRTLVTSSLSRRLILEKLAIKIVCGETFLRKENKA